MPRLPPVPPLSPEEARALRQRRLDLAHAADAGEAWLRQVLAAVRTRFRQRLTGPPPRHLRSVCRRCGRGHSILLDNERTYVEIQGYCRCDLPYATPVAQYMPLDLRVVEDSLVPALTDEYEPPDNPGPRPPMDGR